MGKIKLSGVNGFASDIQSAIDTSSLAINRTNILEINVNDIDQKTDGLAIKVSGAEDNISTLTIKSDELSGEVSNVKGDVSNLTQTVDEISSTVFSHTGSISTLTQTANELSTAIEGTKGDISTLTQTVNGLSSTVSSHTGDITTLKQTTNSLSSTVSSHTGSISTLTQSVNGLNVSVADAKKSATDFLNYSNSKVTIGHGTLSNPIGGNIVLDTSSAPSIFLRNGQTNLASFRPNGVTLYDKGTEVSQFSSNEGLILKDMLQFNGTPFRIEATKTSMGVGNIDSKPSIFFTNSGTKVDVNGNLYAQAIYDAGERVLTGSSDAENFIVVGHTKIAWGSISGNTSHSTVTSSSFENPHYVDLQFAFGTQFSTPPIIFATVTGGWTSSRWATTHDATKTGGEIRLYSSHKNDSQITIRWLAIGEA